MVAEGGQTLAFLNGVVYNEGAMKQFLTDIHTHSYFSPDGVDGIEKMLAAAYEKGVCFYGISEHIDYDLQEYGIPFYGRGAPTDEEEYFHSARHLQEDYAGAMNVLIGVEAGYCDLPKAKQRYAEMIAARRPDFVINSVHNFNGGDYSKKIPFYREDGEGNRTVRPKKEAYKEYLATVQRSVEQTEYPYDIVGHIGYCARYAPYEDYSISVNEFQEAWDGVLTAIIRRDKILEVNTSDKRGRFPFLPSEDVLKRYYQLGGRKVCFSSDAHQTPRILDRWDLVIGALKRIGFTHLTVPCRGEHIKVEI